MKIKINNDINYGYKKELLLPYDSAVLNVKNSLQKEGFGVLSEIDVKNTIKKKLNKDIDNYVILGACSPLNAFKSLQYEPDVGLMLPCNVVVYELNGKIYVSAIKPTIAMGMINNNLLKSVASSIESKLKKVIDSL